jgi:hypothetical protein
MRGSSPAARSLLRKRCCPRIDACRHFRPSHFAAGRRLQCACFHHSTLCENALAASCAGVVHQLHPLAGIDAARLLLFSGDAISYVSKRSAQSNLNDLNCTGDVSLLNGELALPVSWVARVSRLIGNSDTTAKAHHWQGG